MPEQIEDRLAECRAQLDACRRSREQLPQLRERLSHKAYELRDVEQCLDELQQQVQALESLTLESLIDSMFGRKDRKLRERRERCEDVQQQYDEGASELVEISEQIDMLESEATGFDEAERNYRSICDDKMAHVVKRGGEDGQRLSELSVQLDEAKAEQRDVGKGIQVGRHLLERLRSMSKTMGRARNKRIGSFGIGMVAWVATNAITKQGTKGAASRVCEGFGKLAKCVDELTYHDDDPTEAQIRQLAMDMDQFKMQFAPGGVAAGSGTSAILPALERVQELVGHLDERRRHVTSRVAAIERDRLAVIEIA